MDAIIGHIATILIFTAVYLWIAIYAGLIALWYHIIRYAPPKSAIESFVVHLKQPLRGTYNFAFSSSKKSFTQMLFEVLDERTHVKYKISIAVTLFSIVFFYGFFAFILIDGVIGSSNLVMKIINLFTLVVMLDNIRRLTRFGSKLKTDVVNFGNTAEF